MSPVNTAVFCNSNSHFHSYLAELCRLAINSRFLTSSTVEKLKEKKILVGSRRIRREKSDKATDLSDEEAWNLEYDLLTPDEVVIADDMITFQQFGEELFCAPQEDILEGKYNSICSPVAYAHLLNCRILSIPWVQTTWRSCPRRISDNRGDPWVQEIPRSPVPDP